MVTGMAKSCTSCGQTILYRPDERDTCEGCRIRGGPPAPAESAAAAESASTLPPEIREALFCEHPECGNTVLPIEDVDRHDPPTRTREQRRAEGLRTTCLTHTEPARV